MKILFFSLFSELWEHSVPEAYIAEKLKENGHDIYYFSCGGGLSFCQVMEGRGEKFGEPLQKDHCSLCIRACKEIGSVVQPKETFWLKMVDVKESHQSILDKMDWENPLDITYEGVPFGRISMYDVILHFKKQNTELIHEVEKKYFRSQLSTSLRTYLSVKKIIEKKSFDRVVIYSPQYSANHSVAYLFEQRSIPVYFLEAGTNINGRLKTIRSWRWKAFHLVNPLLDIEDSFFDKVSFTEKDLETVTDHFQRLLEGKSHMVYSSSIEKKFDLLERFPRALNKKIVLLTMSSFDEAYSAYQAGLFPYIKANSNVYKDQVEWVSDIISHAHEFEDSYFIIRVHPRDFPNKRESGLSDQGKKLSQLFNELPANVGVNFPADGVSFYNLLVHTDVLTTGWSVTALEAGVLGIPVVTYDKNMPSYPKDVMYTGASRCEYFSNLRLAMKEGWSFKQIESCYRWLALNYCYGALKISESFESYEVRSKPLFLRCLDFLGRRVFKIYTEVFRHMRFKKNNNENLNIIMKLIVSDGQSILKLDEIKRKLEISNFQAEGSFRIQINRLMVSIVKATGHDRVGRLPPVLDKIQRYLNEY